MKKKFKKGFTLVELVIVIAVIAVLAAVLIPTFAGVVNKSKKSAALQTATTAVTVMITSTNGEPITDAYIHIANGGFIYKVGVGGKLTVETALPTAATYFKIDKTTKLQNPSTESIAPDLSDGVTVFLAKAIPGITDGITAAAPTAA